MANKQSLPTMNETKSGFINTNSIGNVIAPEYKEQEETCENFRICDRHEVV